MRTAILMGVLTGLLSFLVLSQTLQPTEHLLRESTQLLTQLAQAQAQAHQEQVAFRNDVQRDRIALQKMLDEHLGQLTHLQAAVWDSVTPEQRWRMDVEHRLRSMEYRPPLALPEEPRP